MFIDSKVCKIGNGDYKEFSVRVSKAAEDPECVANRCIDGLEPPNNYSTLLTEVIRTVCQEKLRNGALHKYVVIAGPKNPFMADLNALTDFGWIDLTMRTIRYHSWRNCDEIFVVYGKPNWESTDIVIQRFYAMTFIDHYAHNIVAHFDCWRNTLGRMIDCDFPI